MKTRFNIDRATTASVLIVALFAAVVSYTHIRDLALLNGYDTLTSYLLPLSVDGLIVGTSFMLVTAGRDGLRSSVARCGLWLGIGATLAANVAYGLPHGLTGALTSAWPAVAFIVIVEAWMQLQKKPKGERTNVRPPKKNIEVSRPEPEPKAVTVSEPKAAKPRKQTKTTQRKRPTKPAAPASVNLTGTPTPYRIAQTLKCGHAKSVELRDIMVREGVDLEVAQKIRNTGMKKEVAV